MIKHTSEIIHPEQRAVFLDDSTATGMGAWSVEYQARAWWDEPPNRHGDGSTWGFADGHSEYWKWQDPDTHKFNFTNEPLWKHKVFPNSLDIPRAQRAAWGGLGY
jgi:prepilin-type processing-associated H-X9-DG protein